MLAGLSRCNSQVLCLTTPTIAKLVADGRLELPTTALSEQCSTTELIGNGRRTIGQIKIDSIAPHERMAFLSEPLARRGS